MSMGEYLGNQVKQYRQKALDMKGEYCHICGSCEDIEVHHINGEREDRPLSKKDNNHVRNLLPVCVACHKEIHSGNKGKWSEYAENGETPGCIEVEEPPHMDEKFDTQTELALSVRAHSEGSRSRAYESLGPCPECDGTISSNEYFVDHMGRFGALLKCDSCGFYKQKRWPINE